MLPFFLLILFSSGSVMAQDTLPRVSKKSFSGSSKRMKQKANELKESLSTDQEEQTARSYEALAGELQDKGEYAKAEEYYKKAKEIYIRLGNRQSQLGTVSRSLARVQEQQRKIAPAIENYKAAAGVVRDTNLSRANTNDARRLEQKDKPDLQQDYARSNTRIFEKMGKQDEISNAYRQLAKTQLSQKKTEDAVTNYQKAFDAADKPQAAADISKDLAKAYVAGNKVKKAIEVSEAALEQSKQAENTEQQIDQLRGLAELYTQDGQNRETGLLLQEAYLLALESGNTLQAKACAQALADYYREQGDTGKSLDTYKDFMGRLDSLIRSDSSLVDAKLFELTEGRIKELELERQLQRELIRKKNNFNYFLIGSVIAMLALLFVVIRSRYAIQVKNKKIALQSLRREMNPHFIFNSLNSINQYIAENKELEANKYLASYSGLMRNMMEHSNKDFVTLATETEQLKKYLDLEHLRFRDQFDYTLYIDEALDPDATMIPNMLIQPHLENAIWHGLRYKEAKGMLQLSFLKKGRQIQVLIVDDGIGQARSQALKTKNQKAHVSLGLANTKERIRLLNELYKTRIAMHMGPAREEEDAGTQVLIELPLIPKT